MWEKSIHFPSALVKWMAQTNKLKGHILDPFLGSPAANNTS